MVLAPSEAEMGAAYAAGQRLIARWPHVSYAEQLEYLDWVGRLYERVAAASPCAVSRRDARRELFVLRYAQRHIAARAQEHARRAVLGFDAAARRASLGAGECRG